MRQHKNPRGFYRPVVSNTTLCCEHRALDHEEQNESRDGKRRCTVPGCPCTGLVTREKGRAGVSREMAEKLMPGVRAGGKGSE